MVNVHTRLRSDLAVLRRAAAALATNGRVDLAGLSILEPGWSLRGYCAAFCGFVHDHHGVEDSVIFPMLADHQAGLGEAIARLRDDHRVVARQASDAELAVAAIGADGSGRDAAVTAIERLADHLGEHLAREERLLAPALNAVSRVIAEDDVPPPPADPLGTPR